MIIHSCGADDADTRILAEEGMGRLGGCVQFFEGTPKDVERYVDLNFTFLIGPSVTYPDPGGWYETVRSIPTRRSCSRRTPRWLPYDGAGRARSGEADLDAGRETVARTAAPSPRRSSRLRREPASRAAGDRMTPTSCCAATSSSRTGSSPAAPSRSPRDGSRPSSARASAPGRGGGPRPLGSLLMPGVVDTHVHAGSFETEDHRRARRRVRRTAGDDDRRHALRPHRARHGARAARREDPPGLRRGDCRRRPLRDDAQGRRRGRAGRAHRGGVARSILALRVRRALVPPDRGPRPAGGVRGARRAPGCPSSCTTSCRRWSSTDSGRCATVARTTRSRTASPTRRSRRPPPRRSCWTSPTGGGAPAPRPLHAPAHVPARRVLPGPGRGGVGRDLRALPPPERDGCGAAGAIAKVNPPIRDEIATRGCGRSCGRAGSIRCRPITRPGRWTRSADRCWMRRRACPGWRASCRRSQRGTGSGNSRSPT